MYKVPIRVIIMRRTKPSYLSASSIIIIMMVSWLAFNGTLANIFSLSSSHTPKQVTLAPCEQNTSSGVTANKLCQLFKLQYHLTHTSLLWLQPLVTLSFHVYLAPRLQSGMLTLIYRPPKP